MPIPVFGITLCIVIVIGFISIGNSVSGLSTTSVNSTENYLQQLNSQANTHEYTLIAEDTTIEI